MFPHIKFNRLCWEVEQYSGSAELSATGLRLRTLCYACYCVDLVYSISCSGGNSGAYE